MDFGAVLTAAKKNKCSQQAVACYETKFRPPKKENRQSKILSQNIKKFLAKKEEEEKRKAAEEKEKKQNLLALRDHKAQSRINKHLKVCKAANKSVLEDAIDTENTAITVAGPSQPDEDDYGYVSQEASAFYNKLMNKYNSMPAEKSIFSSTGKKTIKDIATTKDRVKQALKQQEIEESQGCRKKRKVSANTKISEDNPRAELASDEKVNSEITIKPEKLKTKNKLPPPIDFVQLLKLAEKKQHEPIVIEVRPKQEEPERLLTKKQMKEYAKVKECREVKMEKHRISENSTNDLTCAIESNRPTKHNDFKSEESNNTKKVSASKSTASTASPVLNSKKLAGSIDRHTDTFKNSQQKDKDDFLKERRKLEIERKKLEEMRKSIEEEKRKLNAIKGKKMEDQKRVKVQSNKVTNKMASTSGHDLGKINGTKQITGTSSNFKKPGSLSVKNVKTLNHSKNLSLNKKKNIFPKRQTEYNDDYDEYDSELDDFIDNEPTGESEDYSKYISEIFGYDKSKYKYNYDDDDSAMESNFAQQLKEEFVSTKIGIMEDLEDIRMEAKEKKRKALSKRKKYV